uniref:Enoyl-CoA hydratase n=1 Tax=Chlamydomonas euryale TaxID=1486919 RepID=A0A7R9V344_9CHLO|mmetsp:Transcript_17087/g.51278  ORF Transcript_17087/g.51278 Transcript_17087/m.51278 type:complete len:276 (+) Transcript_17087:194-1021(+)
MVSATPGAMAHKYVDVELRPGGYAVLTITKEPVNSLNLDAWRELDAALAELEENSAVSGLIIVSGLKRDVFCAGNDILELYPPKTTAQRYAEVWTTSNRFLARLHASRLATVAAVRGACPAGGCIIAMCCDHRVMSAPGSIGLNEVQLGIPVPKYWAMVMTKLIGAKAADKLLLTGRLATAQEAKTLGLVDELVPKEQLMASAEGVMLKLVMLPAGAVAATKKSLRADFAQEWEAFSRTEPEGAWTFLNRPDTIRTLEGALQRLSGSKPKPAAKL